MSFVPRLEAPSNDNEYYIVTSAGGLNECIEINNGSAIPNCVGYSWGRVYEYSQIRPNLSRNEAYTWWNYNDGYQRGGTPVVGAIACYSGGSDGSGHVSVVEEVLDNGDIVTSNSAYGGTRFWTLTQTKSSNYAFQTGYIFQGFIYPVYTPTPTPVSRRKNKFPWVLYARKLRNN